MSTLELVVKILASTSALYMCFSPAPAMVRIYQHKATGHMPVLPLVSQWSYNHIWMLYGCVVQEFFPLVATYAVGSVLSMIFLIVYYVNSSNQRCHVLRLAVITLLFNVGTTAYTILGNSMKPTHELAHTVGAIAIACGFLLYASPLATISHVLQTKSTASIPIAMVTVGALSNAIWIVYGFLLHDLILVIPTVVNTSLCVLQLILYIIYHPKRPSLKIMIFRSHNLDQEGPAAAPVLSRKSEQEFSFVHLDTPKYEEMRSPVHIAIQI